MTIMKIEDLPTIEWPEEWDPEEGWPSTAESREVSGDGRTWHHFSVTLPVSFRVLKKVLGAKVINNTRSIEGAKEAIQTYFDEHGKRPTESSSKEMRRWDHWLRKQGSSLRKLCDEMGLPGGYNVNRTIEDLREAIQTYFDKHGKRPAGGTSKEMGRWSAWLRTKNSSLRKLCDEMGLPPHRPRKGR